ncbi:hypothetical protein [Bifidobacterium boum]|jgi:hypothetical protein
MAWMRVDDKLHSHPKRHQAGLRAMGVWVIAGSWCADHLTDGHVPAGMLPALGARPADARTLVQAGLWDEVEGGWQFHDWVQINPSRADIESRRESERQRVAEWRAKRAQLRAIKGGAS